MGFHVLETQSLRDGKGLQGPHLIDHIILNLFQSGIDISPAKSYQIRKSGWAPISTPYCLAREIVFRITPGLLRGIRRQYWPT